MVGGNERMLAMPEVNYIKHLRENEDLNISEISRKIGVDWRTAKKYADGEVVLEPVGRVYTKFLEDAHSAFPDESCGAMIVDNPQRCMTNQMAAQLSSAYMKDCMDFMV